MEVVTFKYMCFLGKSIACATADGAVFLAELGAAY
jgi:hypothetical protein